MARSIEKHIRPIEECIPLPILNPQELFASEVRSDGVQVRRVFLPDGATLPEHVVDRHEKMLEELQKRMDRRPSSQSPENMREYLRYITHIQIQEFHHAPKVPIV